MPVSILGACRFSRGSTPYDRLEPIKALKIIQDDTNLIYENTVIIDIMSMISVILKCSTQSSPKIQAILKVSSKFMNTNNDTVQIIASRHDFRLIIYTHLKRSSSISTALISEFEKS